MPIVFLRSRNATKIANEETNLTFDLSNSNLSSSHNIFKIKLLASEFPTTANSRLVSGAVGKVVQKSWASSGNDTALPLFVLLVAFIQEVQQD